MGLVKCNPYIYIKFEFYNEHYYILISCLLLPDVWIHFLFALSGTLLNELWIVLFSISILSEVMFHKYQLYHVEWIQKHKKLHYIWINQFVQSNNQLQVNRYFNERKNRICFCVITFNLHYIQKKETLLQFHLSKSNK